MITQINSDLKEFLYQNKTISPKLKVFEKKTQIKREWLAYGAIAVLALYLAFGSYARLLFTLIGFIYPAYALFKAFSGKATEKDEHQFHIYWILFGFFLLLDVFGKATWSEFYGYHLIKTIVLLYLALPQTRGASFVYRRVVQPVLRFVLP